MANLGYAAAQPPAGDNVFLGCLPPHWTEAELHGLCAPYGTIVSSVVLRDKLTGQPKGAALVRFSDPGEAAFAVQSLNGFVSDGAARPLEARLAERPEEKGARRAAKTMTQLQRFSPYGRPAPSPMGPAGYPGYGMPGVHPAMLGGGGAPLVLPRRQDIQPDEGANLHIWGLDSRLTDLHLYQAFSPYGAIRSIRVVHDKATGGPKGYGFVQFYNQQDAQSALAVLNGTQVGQRVWKVSIHQGKPPA